MSDFYQSILGTSSIQVDYLEANQLNVSGDFAVNGKTTLQDTTVADLTATDVTSKTFHVDELILTNPLPITSGGTGSAAISSGYVKSDGTIFSSIPRRYLTQM